VMIASPYRLAIMRELRDAPEPPLDELLARLAPADLTLVEGYRWAALPKLEVYRPALGKPPIYPDDAHVVAVAADVPRPADAAARIDWLDLAQPGAVLRWIEQRFGLSSFDGRRR
jgi:molybdopterin-guanine dinucleotide biosynthesis protein B